MDQLHTALENAGFERTKLPISKPLVVHAVAGAGKSTLLRNFAAACPEALAQTCGPADPPNLEQTHIREHFGPQSNKINILDEYPLLEPLRGAWAAVFADPLQYSTGALPPHYVKKTSHRLGVHTAQLISKLICPVSSSSTKPDSVTFSGIFEGQLLGQIIALDDLTASLLARHSVPFACPEQVRSQEFPEVTVVSASPLDKVINKSLLYVALSRHTEKLHVLSPPPHPSS
ncbi:triple gene block 1 [Chaenostoma potexvirus]|uniref:Triple gene block 1 n=2 Tax=Riboviria TaxID=2559587 RepID=A0AAE9MPT5_9VIRU|nr:triple gene block 1 protein [Sutera flower mottle virus]UTI93305.1 triple gene block 1 [Chaenostoma potexvirus]